MPNWTSARLGFIPRTSVVLGSPVPPVAAQAGGDDLRERCEGGGSPASPLSQQHGARARCSTAASADWHRARARPSSSRCGGWPTRPGDRSPRARTRSVRGRDGTRGPARAAHAARPPRRRRMHLSRRNSTSPYTAAPTSAAVRQSTMARARCARTADRTLPAGPTRCHRPASVCTKDANPPPSAARHSSAGARALVGRQEWV